MNDSVSKFTCLIQTVQEQRYCKTLHLTRIE